MKDFGRVVLLLCLYHDEKVLKNFKWLLDFMSAEIDYNNPETIMVDSDADEVSCDGGGGPLGHPVVWYSFDKQNIVECMYCDRRFVKKS